MGSERRICLVYTGLDSCTVDFKDSLVSPYDLDTLYVLQLLDDLIG